jgi:hypothetical protein
MSDSLDFGGWNNLLLLSSLTAATVRIKHKGLPERGPRRASLSSGKRKEEAQEMRWHLKGRLQSPLFLTPIFMVQANLHFNDDLILLKFS